MLRVFLPLLALSALAPAQALTAEERTWLSGHLERTRKLFHEAVANTSAEQWAYKPSADRWSMAECAEHIVVVEDALFGMITGRIAKGEADASKRGNREGDERIVRLMTDRSKKATAPEPVAPTGKRYGSRAEVIAAFDKGRDRTLEFIRTTPMELRNYSAKSAFGVIDAYQWMIYLTAHGERHTLQIQELRADAGFPK